MNCAICKGRMYSLTSVIGKKRVGVTGYRWCPVDNRMFLYRMDKQIDGTTKEYAHLL